MRERKSFDITDEKTSFVEQENEISRNLKVLPENKKVPDLQKLGWSVKKSIFMLTSLLILSLLIGLSKGALCNSSATETPTTSPAGSSVLISPNSLVENVQMGLVAEAVYTSSGFYFQTAQCSRYAFDPNTFAVKWATTHGFPGSCLSMALCPD